MWVAGQGTHLVVWLVRKNMVIKVGDSMMEKGE